MPEPHRLLASVIGWANDARATIDDALGGDSKPLGDKMVASGRLGAFAGGGIGFVVAAIMSTIAVPASVVAGAAIAAVLGVALAWYAARYEPDDDLD